MLGIEIGLITFILVVIFYPTKKQAPKKYNNTTIEFIAGKLLEVEK